MHTPKEKDPPPENPSTAPKTPIDLPGPKENPSLTPKTPIDLPGPKENPPIAPKTPIDLLGPNESNNLLNLVLHFSKADGNLVGVTVSKKGEKAKQKDLENQ